MKTSQFFKTAIFALLCCCTAGQIFGQVEPKKIAELRSFSLKMLEVLPEFPPDSMAIFSPKIKTEYLQTLRTFQKGSQVSDKILPVNFSALEKSIGEAKNWLLNFRVENVLKTAPAPDARLKTCQRNCDAARESERKKCGSDAPCIGESVGNWMTCVLACSEF